MTALQNLLLNYHLVSYPDDKGYTFEQVLKLIEDDSNLIEHAMGFEEFDRRFLTAHLITLDNAISKLVKPLIPTKEVHNKLLAAILCSKALDVPYREGSLIMAQHGYKEANKFELSPTDFVKGLQNDALKLAKVEGF